jgi:hypothetical protein
MNVFSYHILPIIHAYNVGIPWLQSYAQLRSYARLRSEDTTLIVCPTPVGGCDSDRMPDSSRKTWLWSYARLQSEDATPIICPTPVRRYNSGHISWLRSHFLTPIDVTALVVSPDSGHTSWLRSMSVSHVLPPQLWKTSHGQARWLQYLTA